jgi:osmotically-inducible protein OsmY
MKRILTMLLISARQNMKRILTALLISARRNMKRILTALLISATCSLTGCLPAAALVVGATAGGAAIYDKRGVSQMFADRHVTQTAQNIINNDRYLGGQTHISVYTYNGIVLLVGQAPTPELKQRAYMLVDSLRGMKSIEPIKRIWNEITIAPPSSLFERSDDTWLTTAVKTELVATRGVPSNRIKVVTANKVVYLMGIVTRDQGKKAADVARRVAGVRQVVEVFEYYRRIST